MLKVTPLRAFRDNYIWLVHGRDPSRVAVVDPGDAKPVETALQAGGLALEAVLVTHHHADHTGGIQALLATRDVPVFGPQHERVPDLTVPLAAADRADLESLGLAFEVLDVPGHTAGHIAYYGHGALFCGDTLFSAGCGRLFEGTPAQMLASLDAIAALPDDTRVYCAHEYTLSNLKFARAVEPENAAVAEYTAQAEQRRGADQPTLPSTLGLERRVNPFLRCDEPSVQAAARRRAGAPLASRTEVFATVRRWKDEFA
jgi:hydroxyacylglutathione hydrolase